MEGATANEEVDQPLPSKTLHDFEIVEEQVTIIMITMAMMMMMLKQIGEGANHENAVGARQLLDQPGISARQLAQ